MADIRSWSTSAASNNSAAPDGAPENMAPSGVNDTIRENMRADKKQWLQAEWFDHGDSLNTSTIRKDGTTLSLSGTHTDTYHVGRRIRTNDGVNWLYGTISDTTFSGGTQVTVALDSGSFTATVTAVELGILTAKNTGSLGVPLSFTPTLLGSGGTNAHTYGSQLGRYIRVGNLVIFELYLSVTALDAGFAGNVSIGGLPFTSPNTNHTGGCSVTNAQNITYAAGDQQLFARVNPNATAVGLFFAQSGGAQQNVVAGDISATFLIGLAGSYFTA